MEVNDNPKCTFHSTPLPTTHQDDSGKDLLDDLDDVTNKLLGCSALEDTLIEIIDCHWKQAIHGWQPTIPNPKYITQMTPHQRETGGVKRGHDKENRKDAHKQNHKKNLYQESLWKNKIEPGTYRYDPAWPFQGSSTRRYSNIHKRPTDPQLLEHIERVREHLEKTLTKKDSVLTVDEELQTHKNEFSSSYIHNFLSNLSEPNKQDNLCCNPLRLSQSLTDLPHTTSSLKPLLIQSSKNTAPKYSINDQPCSSNSCNVVSAGGDNQINVESTLPSVTVIPQKSHSSNSPTLVAGDITNLELAVNSLESLKKKLTKAVNEDNNNVRKKRIERRSSAGNLPLSSRLMAKSFEKFPTHTLAPQDQLNPLTKLTPSMRKVSDDNEVIMVHLTNSHSSPSSAPAAMSSRTRVRTPIENEQPCYSQILQVDAPNKNFIYSGISGKSMSPANQRKLKGKTTRPSARDINSVPQVKKPKAFTPHRLTSLSKPINFAANPLDTVPVRRGPYEHDTATSLASELLPSISGRKVGVPVLTHRIL